MLICHIEELLPYVHLEKLLRQSEEMKNATFLKK
jgi:hypothetical protein